MGVVHWLVYDTLINGIRKGIKMNYYIGCLKQYAMFSGRARRKEYWMFVLFYTLFGFVFNILDALLETGGVLGLLFALAHFVPALAVTCRRFHDTGRSGWWQLIVLVPIVGAIVFLVFLCYDSKAGSNEYGPNPKGC